MPLSLRRSVFFCLLILTAACSPPLEPEAKPTVQVLRVSYPTSLRPLIGRFQNCSRNFPSLAVFIEESPAAQLNFKDNEIILWLGEPPDLESYSLLLDQEDIRVVIHPDNPAKNLTEREIHNLMSGRSRIWDEAGEDMQQVSVWLYPPENEIQGYFSDIFLGEEDYSPFARIAPDPAAMIESISSDPGAIGLLPGSWDARLLKTVELKNPVRLPVLALTAQEPEGAPRELLACVQRANEIVDTP